MRVAAWCTSATSASVHRAKGGWPYRPEAGKSESGEWTREGRLGAEKTQEEAHKVTGAFTQW